MNHFSGSALAEATRLTRTGRLSEATALIQRTLRGEPAPDMTSDACEGADGAPAPRRSRIIDVDLDEAVETPHAELRSRGWRPFRMDANPRARSAGASHAPDGLGSFLGRVLSGAAFGQGGLARPTPAHTPDVVPDGGTFLTGTYRNRAGTRDYKLYVPSGYGGRPVPLVVMLHGCTQSPDDFAAGTRMNAVADERDCLVVYPAQAASANASKCWNWFNAGDQQRDQGEPSLIAGITRQVMRDYAVDPQRVFVAGLSAGAAAAAIMGSTYPDLYAATGVHSGLACGAASDLPSAFSAMKHGSPRVAPATGPRSRPVVPAIVFHGDKDATVSPRNGEQVIAQLASIATSDLGRRVERGQVPGGHAYSRILHADPQGRTVVEHWVVHGAGHAWSGGSPAGSYTDPHGPDASREMLRFFIEHPRPFDLPPV